MPVPTGVNRQVARRLENWVELSANLLRHLQVVLDVFDYRCESDDIYKINRKLPHKGKSKCGSGYIGKGQLMTPSTILEQPETAEKHSLFGNWEADTVLEARGAGCLLTLIDRKAGG